MTWMAPEITRTSEPFVGDEITMLNGWLDWHRQTLLWKCQGLTAEQLRTAAVEPSNLTLLGLVRHMTEVERSWFRRRFAGEDIAPRYCTDESPDGDLDDVADADAAETSPRSPPRSSCPGRGGRPAAGRRPSTTARHQAEISLRWVFST